MSALAFDRDGAAHHPGVLSNDIARLAAAFPCDGSAADFRFAELAALDALIGTGSASCALAERRIGCGARPVRAIAFDKHDGANWALGWHQDRVIAVRARREVEGFGPWTVKHGQHHVQPPVALLERMVTLRLHLDSVDQNNAPLKIAPGSHRFGRIPETDIAGIVARCGETVCVAQAGDVWLYATLILHASDRAMAGRRRRVLQVDYAADALPGGLEWLLE